jgi:hypothetical protein
MFASVFLQIAAHVCIGEWAYLADGYRPNDSSQAAFLLSVKSEPSQSLYSYSLEMPGTWINGDAERQAGNAVLVFPTSDEAPQTLRLKDCGPVSASFEFADGRIFSMVRRPGNFWQVARLRGWAEYGVPGDPPEFQPRRFARWTVSRRSVLETYVCEMKMAGGQEFEVSFSKSDGSEYIFARANIQQPMSNLRARTSDDNLTGGFVFDGDVAQTALFGSRRGRRGMLAPNNQQQFLRNLASANTVSLILNNEVIATVNLGGSAAAVAALRDCHATL